MSLTEIFCDVDDFCQQFEPHWEQYHLESGLRTRRRKSHLSLSEIMTIVIHFHQSNYRTFKSYYLQHVSKHLTREFPKLVSYSCFVRLMSQAIVPLTIYLLSQRGQCTGISFMDSTTIKVCRNRRVQRNKVFADKGYTSQKLFNEVIKHHVQLITGIRKNMKNKLMPISDKLLLRKRSIIETINDHLKNISRIEHLRHRSFTNFLVNLLSGLLAYCFQENKPSLFVYFSLPAVVA